MSTHVAVPLGEAELLGHEDLLAAGELELAPPQGLHHLSLRRDDAKQIHK